MLTLKKHDGIRCKYERGGFCGTYGNILHLHFKVGERILHVHWVPSKQETPPSNTNTRCHEYAWAQCLDRDVVSKHYSISCEPLALSLSPTLSWDKKCKKDGGREYTY